MGHNLKNEKTYVAEAGAAKILEPDAGGARRGVELLPKRKAKTIIYKMSV